MLTKIEPVSDPKDYGDYKNSKATDSIWDEDYEKNAENFPQQVNMKQNLT